MPSNPLFDVEEKQASKTAVTIVRFRLDRIAASDDIRQIGDQLYSLVEKSGRKHMMLNLSNVDFTASYFLGKMIGLRKRVIEASGRLAVVIAPGSPVADVFEVCGFVRLFEIYSNEQEALQSF